MALTYSYTSNPSYSLPAQSVKGVESAAERLMDSFGQSSMYGLNERLLVPTDGKLITDIGEPEEAQLVDEILRSIEDIDPDQIERIGMFWVTNALRYNNFLSSRGHLPDGNFHADPRLDFKEGRVLFRAPQAGRLVMALFGPACTALEGIVTAPLNRVSYYQCYDPTLIRGSSLFKQMKTRRGIVIGEEGFFLRGPAEREPMKGDHTTRVLESEVWNYWDPSLIHSGTHVENAGRFQIFVDLKSDRDPYLLAY